mmetsp:Transcript_27441/g.80720  ORF Transcript_27441/g.80720 Transcript_27441/m.80720 type:complete len:240 (+) Transcript_27441:370-1089(+)
MPHLEVYSLGIGPVLDRIESPSEGGESSVVRQRGGAPKRRAVRIPPPERHAPHDIVEHGQGLRRELPVRERLETARPAQIIARRGRRRVRRHILQDGVEFLPESPRRGVVVVPLAIPSVQRPLQRRPEGRGERFDNVGRRGLVLPRALVDASGVVRRGADGDRRGDARFGAFQVDAAAIVGRGVGRGVGGTRAHFRGGRGRRAAAGPERVRWRKRRRGMQGGQEDCEGRGVRSSQESHL